MTIEQLTGRYLRLEQELEIVRCRTPWQAAHLDRLAAELSATGREMGRAGDGPTAPSFVPAHPGATG